MNLRDPKTLDLAEDVLAEPGAGDGRLVLWFPTRREAGDRRWERVGTAAHPPMIEAGDILAVSATSTQARQTTAGWLRRFLRTTSPDKAVTLPNGVSAERCGPRRADVMLAWAEPGTAPLDEVRIRARWPDCQDVREVGRNLFVVWGVEPATVGPSEGTAREKAEHFLSIARRSGDDRNIAAALTDLGLLQIQEGEAPRAIVTLEEALGLARRLGDPGREADILSQLGAAAFAAGDVVKAVAWLEQGSKLAIAASDLHTEKLILERLGMAADRTGDPTGGLAHLERALALAIKVGDRRHESKLLWLIALKRAEGGGRGEAIDAATRSIAILEGLGDPKAGWYGEHLRRYRAGEATVRGRLGAAPNGSPTSSGPGLLRMALTATKVMAAFLGSGLKFSSAEVRQARLQACTNCEHHTGMRCRVCGCFTDAKATLLSEDCPIGRWPG